MINSGHRKKRFYKAAAATLKSGLYVITLDGRPVSTPGKSPLLTPNTALALALAAEWEAQQEFIEQRLMQLNLLAFAAIDQVTPDRLACIDEIAAYGGSDLLCYRAAGPAPLIARQSAAWDPLLAWAERQYGASLIATTGIGHVPQSPEALMALRSGFTDADPFLLAALRSAVGICGSLVLGLALMEGRLDAVSAWRTSQVDEDWQRETWGEDAEDSARRADAFMALGHAGQMMRLLRG